MTIGMLNLSEMHPDQVRQLKEHLKKLGVDSSDRRDAYRALCFLADHGSAVEQAFREAHGRTPDSISEICQSLRIIVDGPNGEFW